MVAELDPKPVLKAGRPTLPVCQCARPMPGEVIDSRPYPGHPLAVRKRRLRCGHCGRRFGTIEVLATGDLINWLNAQPGFSDGEGI